MRARGRARLGWDEELALARRARGGDKRAREELILSQYGLPFHLSKKFHGADRGDLIQAGFEGLVRAADRFDPDRGLRFATIAWRYVTGYMVNWICREENGVKSHAAKRIFFGLRKMLDQLEREGIEPTVELLAARFGATEDLVEHMLRGRHISMEELQPHQHPTCEAITPEMDSESNEEKALFEAALDTLGARDRHILASLGGLDGRDHYPTLTEIGRELNISRERVRQLAKRAVARLRIRLGVDSGNVH